MSLDTTATSAVSCIANQQIGSHILTGQHRDTNTQHRKKGIATQLITTLFKQLEKQNIDIVEVKAFNDNIAATNLYEKFGFDVLWVNYRRKISNN